MQEKMSQEELAAFWQQKMAEAKRHLKKSSKNDLIRTVINMSVRTYELESIIEKLQGDINEESVPDSEPSSQS
jgi:predicted Holliday junction resolvase-like endonuclease